MSLRDYVVDGRQLLYVPHEAMVEVVLNLPDGWTVQDVFLAAMEHDVAIDEQGRCTYITAEGRQCVLDLGPNHAADAALHSFDWDES